jgi:hypothetical protein
MSRRVQCGCRLVWSSVVALVVLGREGPLLAQDDESLLTGSPPGPAEASIGSDEVHRTAPRDTWKTVSFELAAHTEYTTVPIHGGTNPFGVGFGGRFGVVVSDLYLGATIVDYLGGSDVTLSDRSLLYGGVVGYGLRTSLAGVHLIARPELGVGDAAVSHTDPSKVTADVVSSASSSSSSDTTTVNSLYLQPALTLMAAGETVFVDVNGSMLVLPSISYGGSSQPATWISYGVRGELGLRF